MEKILTRQAASGARNFRHLRQRASVRLVSSSNNSRRDAAAEKTELGALLIRLIERCRRHIAPGLILSLNARLGGEKLLARAESLALDFVICEIVSNAYRYAHPTGAPVEVTIECECAPNGEITIDIGDDGVGLAPDFAEWRDGGDGMAAVRAKLQTIDAILNVTTDDLGLRFQIILHPRRRIRSNPSRGNFVWL